LGGRESSLGGGRGGENKEFSKCKKAITGFGTALWVKARLIGGEVNHRAIKEKRENLPKKEQEGKRGVIRHWQLASVTSNRGIAGFVRSVLSLARGKTRGRTTSKGGKGSFRKGTLPVKENRG